MSRMFITPYTSSIERFIADAAEFDIIATKDHDGGYHLDAGQDGRAHIVQRGNRIILTERPGADLAILTEDMVSEHDDDFDRIVKLMRRSELRANGRRTS